MKLLYVVNYAEFFLSHRLILALGAQRRGDEVHVAAQDGPLAAEVRGHGLLFHVLPRIRGTQEPVHEAHVAASMLGLFRRVRPDIVHLVTIKPVLYGGLAARLARVPAVVSAIPGLGTVFLASGFRARLRRIAAMSAYRAATRHPNQRVIVQNETDQRFFRDEVGVPVERLVLIAGSGVDLHAFQPTPEPAGVPVVVLAARMLRDKGVIEFVEAARILREGGVSARFVLAGGTDPDNPTAVDERTLAGWVREGLVE